MTPAAPATPSPALPPQAPPQAPVPAQAAAANHNAAVAAAAAARELAAERERVAEAGRRQQAELQRWKEDQMRAFVTALRSKEAAHMATLEQAWAARERSREAQLLERQAEFGKLEARLRKRLGEVEGRERHVAAAEEKLAARSAQQTSDMRVLQRRLREEAEHQVAMERLKLEAVDKARAGLERELEAAQAKCRALEAEFDEFRAAARSSPEAALRSTIGRLELEKAELQRRVDAAAAATAAERSEREKTKLQLFRCAREVQRLQQCITALRSKEEQRVRMAYLAEEQRFVLDGDRHALKQIACDLDALRRATFAGPGAGQPSAAAAAGTDGNTQQQQAASPPRAPGRPAATAASPSLPREQSPAKGNATRDDTGGAGVGAAGVRRGDGEAAPGDSPWTQGPAAAGASPTQRGQAQVHTTTSAGAYSYTASSRSTVGAAQFEASRGVATSSGPGSSPAARTVARVAVHSVAGTDTSTGSGGAGNGEGVGAADQGRVVREPSLAMGDRSRELERLKLERWELLRTGAYSSSTYQACMRGNSAHARRTTVHTCVAPCRLTPRVPTGHPIVQALDQRIRLHTAS